jgi:tetratricopeptide (TPR) repeat protein
MSKQQYTEALYEYRIAADQNTGTGKIAALQGVADMAQRLGRSDEQIAALREVIEVAPTSADAHNQLGMVLGQLGRNEEAIPVFETVVELDPKYTAGHYNIGYALIQMKRFAEAIPHLERAIALDPKFDRAIYQLGVAETQTGQYAQAWEHIHAVQDMGIMPDPGIVSTLRSKMPEPPR